MCGIFGHTKADSGPASRNSTAALQTLKHRGPDQWGEWQDKHIYMGHRRLSILDLSTKGRQPLRDQKVTIIVNGEIYNFQEIKNQLEKKYHFKSQSDSEVLIFGYLEWGIDELLAKIEGMYAFALYDEQRKKVFLARDRAGIKPLFYSQIGGRVAWASELKALEKYHEHELPEVDYTAIYDYLTYLYIPRPKTMYKNICKLDPGSYLTVDLSADRVTIKQYWQLQVTEKEVSIDEASQRVRELVASAIKQQLISDVPVGFFISGGMDSSIVVANAKADVKQLNTYAIGFDEKEHDETKYASMIAKKFRTNHTRKEISADDAKRLFSKIRDWYDEPFADTSAFPTHLVSKLAKRSSTVVLTGDGGDEVFGGYNWYRDFNTRSRSKALVPLRSRARTDKELEEYSKLMGGLASENREHYKKIFSIGDDYDDYWYFRKFYKSELTPYKRLQYLDFNTYLPDDILTKVDRASMVVSLECRVPLLSTPLVEYVFSLPEKIIYYNGELKGLMKHAFKTDLPKSILAREKKGFSIPTGRWKPKLMKVGRQMQEHILLEFYPELMRLDLP